MGFWQGAANTFDHVMGGIAEAGGHGPNQHALKKCSCGHHYNYHE